MSRTDNLNSWFRFWALFFAFRKNIFARPSMLALTLSLALSFPALQQALHQLCNPSEVLLLLKKNDNDLFCLQQKQILSDGLSAMIKPRM
jgi:hypothetical protein